MSESDWCENAVVTSATFDVVHLRLKKKKKQKDEQMDGLVVFCQ